MNIKRISRLNHLTPFLPTAIAFLLSVAPLCEAAAQTLDASPSGTQVDRSAVGAASRSSLESAAAPNVGQSKTDASNDQPTVRMTDLAELKRADDYLRQRLEGSTVRVSLWDAKGRKVDCVELHSQPALRNPLLAGHALQLAPRFAEGFNASAPTPAESVLEPLFEVQPRDASSKSSSRTASCPTGTVPIPEVTKDDLRRFETLDDFFAKVPSHIRRGRTALISTPTGVSPPYHSGPTSQHQYAHAYRYTTNWGAQANINIWAPYTELNSEFSLAQIWVVGGSGTGLQTLEVGTQKYHDLYGDDRTHLFIYSTRDAYKTTGCYNNKCGDFVQVSSSIYPGAAFSATSAIDGAQYEANVHWFKDMDGGAWWLNVMGQWVGYYPRALYSASGVQNRASEIDFGGEIIDNRNLSLHTSTDMGSGRFPSAWYGKAAYMRLLRYNYATTTSPNTVWYTDAVGLTTSRSDAACYDISYYTGDPNWGSYFFFGGPGYDYNNCR